MDAKMRDKQAVAEMYETWGLTDTTKPEIEFETADKDEESLFVSSSEADKGEIRPAVATYKKYSPQLCSTGSKEGTDPSIAVSFDAPIPSFLVGKSEKTMHSTSADPSVAVSFDAPIPSFLVGKSEKATHSTSSGYTSTLNNAALTLVESEDTTLPPAASQNSNRQSIMASYHKTHHARHPPLPPSQKPIMARASTSLAYPGYQRKPRLQESPKVLPQAQQKARKSTRPVTQASHTQRNNPHGSRKGAKRGLLSSRYTTYVESDAETDIIESRKAGYTSGSGKYPATTLSSRTARSHRSSEVFGDEDFGDSGSVDISERDSVDNGKAKKLQTTQASPIQRKNLRGSRKGIQRSLVNSRYTTYVESDTDTDTMEFRKAGYTSESGKYPATTLSSRTARSHRSSEVFGDEDFGDSGSVDISERDSVDNGKAKKLQTTQASPIPKKNLRGSRKGIQRSLVNSRYTTYVGSDAETDTMGFRKASHTSELGKHPAAAVFSRTAGLRGSSEVFQHEDFSDSSSIDIGEGDNVDNGKAKKLQATATSTLPSRRGMAEQRNENRGKGIRKNEQYKNHDQVKEGQVKKQKPNKETQGKAIGKKAKRQMSTREINELLRNAIY